jgi:diguanylate cyclase (GGDEF)-like protein
VALEPFSLIMLDLDEFKSVNDGLGHQAGDRLLAQISRAVEGAGRESDHVFRYGGDEFAVILPGTDATSALGVAERVRAAIHELGGPDTPWFDAGLSITVSIGVATFPRDGATPEAILLAADRACFVAKRTGNGLIATADEGLAIARDFAFKEPTPIDAVQPVTEADGADTGIAFMGEPIAASGRPAEPDPGPLGVTLPLIPAPDGSAAT